MSKHNPIRHHDIQRMANELHDASTDGRLRTFFEHDDPKMQLLDQEKPRRYALIGALLMFRCRPEFGHWSARGKPKEICPHTQRGRRGGPIRSMNANCQVIFRALFHGEAQVIWWSLMNPKGSYWLKDGGRFVSIPVMQMLLPMKYRVDTTADPDPQNWDNHEFRDNWNKFLLQEYGQESSRLFMDITGNNPDVPITVPWVPVPPRPLPRRSARNDMKSVVYFARTFRQGKQKDSCKIGFTTQNDVKDRLKQENTGNEEEIVLAYTVPGNFSLEHHIQRRLRHANIRSGGGKEWFDWNEAEKYIKEVIRTNPYLMSDGLLLNT